MADSTVALAEFPGGGVWGEVDFVFDLATVAGSGVGSIRHFGSLIGGGRYCDTDRDIYNRSRNEGLRLPSSRGVR